MGKINVARVILGGLLAGLIINVSEFVLNSFVIADEMAALMQRLDLPAVVRRPLMAPTVEWGQIYFQRKIDPSPF